MHIVVMPQHHKASAVCVNHVITLFEQERLGLITCLWGSSRCRDAEVSFNPVYVTEENVGNDKRPVTEVKRQVGRILAIPHIAPHQTTGTGCVK